MYRGRHVKHGFVWSRRAAGVAVGVGAAGAAVWGASGSAQAAEVSSVPSSSPVVPSHVRDVVSAAFVEAARRDDHPVGREFSYYRLDGRTRYFGPGSRERIAVSVNEALAGTPLAPGCTELGECDAELTSAALSGLVRRDKALGRFLDNPGEVIADAVMGRSFVDRVGGTVHGVERTGGRVEKTIDELGGSRAVLVGGPEKWVAAGLPLVIPSDRVIDCLQPVWDEQAKPILEAVVDTGRHTLIIPAVGAVLGGVAGLATGAGAGSLAGIVAGLLNPLAPIVGGIPGGVIGGVLGSLLGVPLGALLGAVSGGASGWALSALAHSLLGAFVGGIVGGVLPDLVGLTVGALLGALPGALAGGLLGLLASFVLPPFLYILTTVILAGLSVIVPTALAFLPALAWVGGSAVAALVASFMNAAVLTAIVWGIPALIATVITLLAGATTLAPGIIAAGSTIATAVSGVLTALGLMGGPLAAIPGAIMAAAGALAGVAGAITAGAAGLTGVAATILTVVAGGMGLFFLAAWAITFPLYWAAFSALGLVPLTLMVAGVAALGILASPIMALPVLPLTFFASLLLGTPLAALAGGLLGALLGSGVGWLLAQPFKLLTIPAGVILGALAGIVNPVNLIPALFGALLGGGFGALLGPWILGPSGALLGFLAGDGLARLVSAALLALPGALVGGLVGAPLGAGAGVLASLPLFALMTIAGVGVRLSRHYTQHPEAVIDWGGIVRVITRAWDDSTGKRIIAAIGEPFRLVGAAGREAAGKAWAGVLDALPGLRRTVEQVAAWWGSWKRAHLDRSNMVDGAAVLAPVGVVAGALLGALAGWGLSAANPLNALVIAPAAVIGGILGHLAGRLVGGLLGVPAGMLMGWAALALPHMLADSLLGALTGALSALPLSTVLGAILGGLSGVGAGWALSSILPLLGMLPFFVLNWLPSWAATMGLSTLLYAIPAVILLAASLVPAAILGLAAGLGASAVILTPLVVLFGVVAIAGILAFMGLVIAVTVNPLSWSFAITLIPLIAVGSLVAGVVAIVATVIAAVVITALVGLPVFAGAAALMTGGLGLLLGAGYLALLALSPVVATLVDALVTGGVTLAAKLLLAVVLMPLLGLAGIPAGGLLGVLASPLLSPVTSLLGGLLGGLHGLASPLNLLGMIPGAFVGSLLGALVGGLVGIPAGAVPAAAVAWLVATILSAPVTTLTGSLLGAGLGGVGGALLGAVVGALLPRKKQSGVPLPVASSAPAGVGDLAPSPLSGPGALEPQVIRFGDAAPVLRLVREWGKHPQKREQSVSVVVPASVCAA